MIVTLTFFDYSETEETEKFVLKEKDEDLFDAIKLIFIGPSTESISKTKIVFYTMRYRTLIVIIAWVKWIYP